MREEPPMTAIQPQLVLRSAQTLTHQVGDGDDIIAQLAVDDAGFR
jgi:hypothetical protein